MYQLELVGAAEGGKVEEDVGDGAAGCEMVEEGLNGWVVG